MLWLIKNTSVSQLRGFASPIFFSKLDTNELKAPTLTDLEVRGTNSLDRTAIT